MVDLRHYEANYLTGRGKDDTLEGHEDDARDYRRSKLFLDLRRT